LGDLDYTDDHGVVHVAAVEGVGVAYDDASPGAVGECKTGLEPGAITNVKSYRRFHDTTLRFPPQIIKGRRTSKSVEVYCRTCGT